MTSLIEKLHTIGNIDFKRIAVLLRHSERGEIPAGSFGTEVMLSENGIKEAISFGEKIADLKITHIFCSPIDRCVQTAQFIKEGLTGKQQNIQITQETQLGTPGFHIANADIAGKAYLDYGCSGVFEHFSQGEKIPGIASVESLKTDAMQWIKDKTSQNGITLFVTHDALIAHFAYANKIHTYTKENWIQFLDGIIIVF
ncbi:histidine phosphatase family protein [Fibrobacter sp.]|uniref:histidine phosphatase family protein n=1 Tax=Fibrobacter sp. TaxID=35828 RepID=UPI0025C525A0|nr:histidine phosphatase family protein [Fibrobacter sp.]MBR3070611.1 histidine phosphatase family protein [Fibrobacter sp.]